MRVRFSDTMLTSLKSAPKDDVFERRDNAGGRAVASLEMLLQNES